MYDNIRVPPSPPPPAIIGLGGAVHNISSVILMVSKLEDGVLVMQWCAGKGGCSVRGFALYRKRVLYCCVKWCWESRVCCAWSACAVHDVSVKKVRFIVYGVGSQVKGAYCVSGTTIGRHMDWMYEKGEPAWVALCKIWPLMLYIEWLCRMREPVTLLCTKSVLGNS